jgi:hypothetical protein
LAYCIAQFFKQRVKGLGLILAHLTDNKAMAGALVGHGICTQIQYCLQALDDHNMDLEGTLSRAFEVILERYKATLR